jgi:hypothetical protein
MGYLLEVYQPNGEFALRSAAESLPLGFRVMWRQTATIKRPNEAKKPEEIRRILRGHAPGSEAAH